MTPATLRLAARGNISRSVDGESSRFGGTGLGLTITQRFARLMVGDVMVKSTEGKGPTFTLCVPAGVAAPMQVAA